MSAETLRKAAEKMRAENVVRGGAQFCDCNPDTSDWFDRSICPEPCGSMHYVCDICSRIKGRCSVAEQGRQNTNRLAAAWTAVADWLDETADEVQGWPVELPRDRLALTVATAYLGGDQ